MKLLLALAAIGVTGATPPRLYDVRLEVTSGERVIAQPRLLVAAGEPARFEVSDGPDRSWSATITPTPQAGAPAVHVAWAMSVTDKAGDRTDVRRMTTELTLADPGTARLAAPVHGAQVPFAIRLDLRSAARP